MTISPVRKATLVLTQLLTLHVKYVQAQLADNLQQKSTLIKFNYDADYLKSVYRSLIEFAGNGELR